LTLNVLLSFAAVRARVIGERIRDKIAASKKKGMWMAACRRSVIRRRTASSSSTKARRKPALHLSPLCRTRLGPVVEGRARRPQHPEQVADERIGRPRGGKPFSRGALYLMLQNRIYRGEIVHKGAIPSW